MKKFASFLMSVFLFPLSGTAAQIASGVPNYDIHHYHDISLTGYINCELNKFDNRTEFYRLSLTDNTQRINLVDSIADSDRNKEEYEKILTICPAGSRCTITGDLETREGQTFIFFTKIKNVVKETGQAAAGSEPVDVSDKNVKYSHAELYENVEITGYIDCKIEHFGTPSDYYLLSLNDSSREIMLVPSINNEGEAGKDLYKRILGICPEYSRCTLTGDLKITNDSYREFIRIKKIVKD